MIDVELEYAGEPGLLTEEDMAKAVDRPPAYFSSVKRHSPERYKMLLKLGNGSLLTGYIRFQTLSQRKLYQFGELYNLVEEHDRKLIKNYLEHKEFKKIVSLAFATQEQVLNEEQYNNLNRFNKKLAGIAFKYNLFQKYNIPEKEYHEYI